MVRFSHVYGKAHGYFGIWVKPVRPYAFYRRLSNQGSAGARRAGRAGAAGRARAAADPPSVETGRGPCAERRPAPAGARRGRRWKGKEMPTRGSLSPHYLREGPESAQKAGFDLSA